MWNGYYDFDIDVKDSWFSPYVGVGFGIGWEEIELDIEATTLPDDPSDSVTGKASTTQDDSGFVYQIMAGTTTQFSDDLFSDIGYRFLKTENVSAHEFGVNLRYMF